MDHGMEFKAKFQSVEIYFKCKQIILISMCTNLFQMQTNLYYRPPEGGRLYDMKVVSGYAFLRTYFV